jgi:ferredoxin
MPWIVDKDKCSGCGLCTETAPDVFRMDDNEEFAECFSADAAKDDEAAMEARDGCPEESITWQD